MTAAPPPQLRLHSEPEHARPVAASHAGIDLLYSSPEEELYYESNAHLEAAQDVFCLLAVAQFLGICSASSVDE